MKIKVCGMKYKENIEQVASLHPDYIGFIFYPSSKRYVTGELEIPQLPVGIKKIGVFVNEAEDKVVDSIHKYELDGVQLHGNESPEFCKQIKIISPVIKVFGIDDNFDFKRLEEYKECCNFFLFDTKTSEYGGSGKQFSWKKLEEYTLTIPFFLSGGIDIEDGEEIKRIANQYPLLYAIDVNSCFEISPGLKDTMKLKRMIKIFK